MNLSEKYRPQVHFTPSKNWMNDPNGLLFYKGKYHLFYQHNPYADIWGNMSWGHASSTDLMTWEEHPVAIACGENYGIFSGSAVVDYTNTTGFGSIDNPAMVAIFTIHQNDESNQSQALAYSLDEGITWTLYEGNPVLDLSMPDFRDPKVWRDDEKNRWLMAVVKPKEFKVSFFQSENLKEWSLLSEFGDQGAIGGCWECPDLFPLTTSDGVTKWILLVSINPGGPNGGSATQFFIGHWDGTSFIADDKEIRWIDHGFDNYAGVTFNDAPDGRRVFIGWMSNWDYARDVPTSPWRSAMTLPRELSLESRDGKFFLIQEPVREFSAPTHRVEMSTTKTSSFTIVNGDKSLLVTYSPEARELTIDRSASWFGQTHLLHTAHLSDPTFTLVLDKSGIEIFGDQGATVLTDLTLCDGGELIAGPGVTLNSL